jgi:hypothetical protein
VHNHRCSEGTHHIMPGRPSGGGGALLGELEAGGSNCRPGLCINGPRGTPGRVGSGQGEVAGGTPTTPTGLGE